MGDGNRLYMCGTNAHLPKDWVIYVSFSLLLLIEKFYKNHAQEIYFNFPLNILNDLNICIVKFFNYDMRTIIFICSATKYCAVTK